MIAQQRRLLALLLSLLVAVLAFATPTLADEPKKAAVGESAQENSGTNTLIGRLARPG